MKRPPEPPTTRFAGTAAVVKLAALLHEAGLGRDDGARRQMATDLIEWQNRSWFEPDDLRRLTALARAGRFEAWDCPTCGERVYEGRPDDWGEYQGVWQADYSSYPGGHRRQCDCCRCHHGRRRGLDIDTSNDFATLARRD